jgi:tetratricopeptide (TPR) repeat protein
MRNLFLFGVLTWMTGNPILALVVVLVVSAAGYGYLSGRLFRIPRAMNRWLAIRELDRAVRTNPHDATAQADLGRLLVEAGQPARALSHLEVAHARAPEVAENAYYLGAARLRLGDATRGRPLIEEALSRDPRLGYGEPHLRLADYYLEHGEPAEALPHLQRFAEVHASSVEGQYKLARAWLATGRAERAREALDDAVRAYRGAPWFKRREERWWRIRSAWLRWTLPR